MDNISAEWGENVAQQLKHKTSFYTKKELVKINSTYLISLINKSSEPATINASKLDELKSEIEKTIELIPEKNNVNPLKSNAYRPYLKQFNQLGTLIREKLGWVNKGYYTGLWIAIGMPMGIPLGLPLGIAQGNIAIGIPLGLPIGMAIGVAIGASLDKKAEKEGRVLK